MDHAALLAIRRRDDKLNLALPARMYTRRRLNRSRRTYASLSLSPLALPAAGLLCLVRQGRSIDRHVRRRPFVFRRDDSSSSSSFPDETTAPIRATGTTTWGATFRIAFSVADPPRISRLYAQLPSPGFLGPRGESVGRRGPTATSPCFASAPQAAEEAIVQNFFVFNPSIIILPRSSNCCPLAPSPALTIPAVVSSYLAVVVVFVFDEFVVAELTLFKPIDRSRVFADICLLHSTSDAAADQQLTWKSMRVELFLSTNNNRSAGDSDLQQIRWWYTDAVIPFDKWLHPLCDMSKLPNHPTVSFIWFPLDKLPISGNRNGTSTCCYRAVSVVDRGRALKFVNITRQDGVPFAALKPGTGFTITCHTLANTPDRLPRHILMFPRVDMDRSHVVHFLSIEFGFVNKKMWVVSIDMSTKTAIRAQEKEQPP
ncbi:hypothetical protein HU200_066103 [Digitaria exilis]|uniref:DUF1618 domain-containing protein n=1 Tax=Digitaria exilis TaxID=1010633 RepID=A0A835A736_9POAL|nr:hypothetical protein HU200_066103 [Digitaria exilis]